MRMEALCFELGAQWALRTLAKALNTAESKAVGSARINAIHLSDCIAPPMVLIAREIRAEAQARYPDIELKECRVWVPASVMED